MFSIKRMVKSSGRARISQWEIEVLGAEPPAAESKRVWRRNPCSYI